MSRLHFVRLPSNSFNVNNVWTSLVFALIVSIINGYIFLFISTYFGMSENQGNMNNLSSTEKFFTLLLLAPSLETVMFQSIPIELSLYFSKKKWIAVLLSSSCFSLVHFYNPVYIVMTFFGGLILSIFYLHCQKLGEFPLGYVILLHSLYNLFGYLFVV